MLIEIFVILGVELKTFFLINHPENDFEQTLGEGCILPDGQCAIAWNNGKSHGCYPSFEAFKTIQDKQPTRKIAFDFLSRDGKNLNTFKLVRIDDVTGISGTGEVAVGCEFISGIVVLQWKTEFASTFWYSSLATVEEFHGHGGKTVIQRDA